MRIELFDVDEFVSINNLQEVTSPVLFERGGIPNPKGLISNEIFGVNVKSRKQTFAYIDLGGHFFHPHIYKIIKRVFRNIDKIVNGEEYFSITSKGELIKDPNGDTGIDFLYNNWNKIKWNGNGGMSSERTNLISKSKKNEVFMTKEIVIPAFYRDISSSEGGGGETEKINNFYVRLIRMSALIKDRDMFDFSFHNTNFNIQNTLVEIYDFFKNKLDKKNGMLRKYLLGKNVDYCTRAVISAPTFNGNSMSDNMVNYEYTALPISLMCSLCYPFIIAWLRNFFEREIHENQAMKMIDNGEIGEILNAESYFNDQYIKKCVDKYVKDPSSRYDIIPVPLTNGKETYLKFQGRYVYDKLEKASICERYMTWTDLLFLACSDVAENKHVMVTRYPISHNFNIFFSKIRISSTTRTVPMMINGKIYPWYPDIDLNMSKSEVSNNFIDTAVFNNSYLAGLNGDYDGDQITIKVLWTQEANEECDKLMYSKSTLLNTKGGNWRSIDLEAIQSLYVLTKDKV